MPFTKKREKSPSSTPVPSTEAAQNDGSQLPETEWDAMAKVLNAIYDYRTEDDIDPSKLFHRKVNKRIIPEYYETIKEPMAMSTIKQKLNSRAYASFREFVRDFALIPFNAQVFNRQDSGAFQDALTIKEQLEKQLQLLVQDGVITQEVATLPDLGEIPTYEDPPIEEGEGANDEDESSDDEGEEDEEDEGEEDDEVPKKKRGRGRPPLKRDGVNEGSGKLRARPPKLQTPEESRIQAVLKGIRKLKDSRGQLIIRGFDRLPDKQTLPDYYNEIKQPMAYDVLKRKFKRKKYSTLESFMADMNLMFDNAKSYNTDESQIYQDAVQLQIHAGKLYDTERAKPDDSFADEFGKVLMPNGVLHNGELYRVGDWVHIQNPNDLTKPIPAQIYRTFKQQGGQQMVNACWYYRPEQTVHRSDKHFFEGEVMKTGRYKDHHVEQIEGRCFIMFTTRYFKGRPRSIPAGTDVYVCEARYNERDHSFNKIKTWASCQPDEVRDRDYEMDIFEKPKSYKKVPSPIAYLLKDEQKETDDLPKPQWGAEGAPPEIGAVHRRPRGSKDSPPPEPTPPPLSKVSTPAPSRPSVTPVASFQNQTPATQAQHYQRPPSTVAGVTRPSNYGASHPQSYTQPSQSPGPARPTTAQTSSFTPAPQTPQQLAQQTQAPRTAPVASHPSTYQQSSQSSVTIPPNPSTFAPRPSTSSYRDLPSVEVYTLPEHANLSIPFEIRSQYLRDDAGRVLFFTAPPVLSTSETSTAVTGHSARYLAEKARRQETLAQKRKVRELEKDAEHRASKQAKLEENEVFGKEIQALKVHALGVLEEQLRGNVAQNLTDANIHALSQAQRRSFDKVTEMQEKDLARVSRRKVKWEGSIYEDDWDNRLVS
ncbi:chromatin remodeling complex [Polychaeton citri CBS 116435]|uniref:Chromatin remodeling complex n=1 Tax=Polychaeton citri CBS 116435 TaxID=1314669 RepID=A0A9P4UJD1_9PEZI|nr:chromatin remodeling complex [Polychaeton citri CBS 116435]